MNNELAAMTCDNGLQSLEQSISKIFVLCQDGMMYHLQQGQEEEYENIEKDIHDFSRHKLNKDFNKSWNLCLLAKGTITLGSKLYLGDNAVEKQSE